ncbi:MAG: site-specific integrase [Bryobacterales bacterium]|nr:site-specific integrase [Bryobacterales bacterium]
MWKSSYAVQRKLLRGNAWRAIGTKTAEWSKQERRRRSGGGTFTFTPAPATGMGSGSTAKFRSARSLRLKKWEAEKKLKAIIDREMTEGHAPPDATMTLRQFWNERFLPLEVRWRQSTRAVIEIVFTKHVLEKFGAKPLDEIKRFELQTHLNSLALVYSFTRSLSSRRSALGPKQFSTKR